MSVQSHDLHLLTGAYAVDALTGAELAKFEKHLDQCCSCAEEVRSLRETAARIGEVDVANHPHLGIGECAGKRRRGFAFRAAQLALEYARASLDAQAVVIKMLTGNESSRNLALALGAHHVGEEPSDSGATFDVFRLWLHDTPKEE